MNLFNLVAKITLDTKDYEEGIGKSKNAISGLSSWTVAKGALIAKGIEQGARALFKFGQAAVQSYADYEQLIGGVDTLFNKAGKSWAEYAEEQKKSGRMTIENAVQIYDEYEKLAKGADMVKENAAQAFKTAGMSANEYMETVTSFSASLIQSLGGDTEKAAEYAHMAIVDMSDNANKMGSDMTLIQNAYGGFAKGNYTMLDNLKLGYGGTQKEMQRLIKDAAKLDKSIDANSMSFGNIVKAIHAVQDNMKITGTTAKEASETISGSISSMKASWENLLVGFADEESDLDGLITQFVDSVYTVGDNVIPRVETVITTVGIVIQQRLPEALSKGTEALANALPGFLEYGGQFVITLGEGILAAIPKFTEKLPKIINSFGNFISANLPKILDLGISILIELGKGLLLALPDLFNNADKIINSLFEYLINLVGKIVGVGVEIVKKIWEGIKSKWNEFKTNFKREWDSLVEWAKGVVSAFVNVGKTLVGKIKQGISDAWDGLKSWFNGLWDGLFGHRSVNVDVDYSNGSRRDGYHANGLEYVPFDGYTAELHKGERVLTAAEAKAYNEGGQMHNEVQLNFYYTGDLDEDKAYEYGQILGEETSRTLRSRGVLV